MSDEQEQGVPPTGSGCQPTALAAVPASSRSGIPNAEDALRALILSIEIDSAATRNLVRAAEAARASLPPDPEKPLESAVFMATDFGVYGRVEITLPRNNGGDDQFDTDFEATLEYVRGVIGRRKEARAQAMSAGTAKTEGLGAQPASAVAESDAPLTPGGQHE